MERKKNIFYLTNSYPFSAKEIFPEHELPYLVRQNFKVYIFPASFGEEKLSIPDEVTLNTCLIMSKWDKFKALFSIKAVKIALHEIAGCHRNKANISLISLIKNLGIALTSAKRLKKITLIQKIFLYIPFGALVLLLGLVY